MGCLMSKKGEDEAIERNKEINSYIKEDQKQKWREVKLLLLGTGESGKSTIVKQMKLINDKGYTDVERLGYRNLVFCNTIQSLIVIIKAMSKLDIEFFDPERLKDAQTLLQLAGSLEKNGPLNVDLYKSMKEIWMDSGIKECFKRSREYQLIDSAEYFLNDLDRLGCQEYIPTDQDILRTRVKTTGIIETTVIFNDLQMKLVDVGGQRTERRKWIHCFDDVHAIIFIVALSEYDLSLREEPDVNRMVESLKLFESMCNNEIFRETCMILFLNKKDLFVKKIERSPLTICFPEYRGENNYETAVRYIQAKFESTNLYLQSKTIFTHETCATDTDNVKKVFYDIKAIMIRKILDSQGLM